MSDDNEKAKEEERELKTESFLFTSFFIEVLVYVEHLPTTYPTSSAGHPLHVRPTYLPIYRLDCLSVALLVIILSSHIKYNAITTTLQSPGALHFAFLNTREKNVFLYEFFIIHFKMRGHLLF